MEAIGITLACVAVLVVPALLLSLRQRNGFWRHRRVRLAGSERIFIHMGENKNKISTKITNGLLRFIIAMMPFLCCFLAHTAHAQIPSIITQPASQSSAVGGTIQFTVSATGGGTLAYQWRKNGVNTANGTFSGRATVSGATTTAMTLTGVTTNDQANYTVYINNTSGSITSSVASLAVIVAPAITTQPKSATTNVGATVSFSVVASGTAPLSYQWYDNSAPISGATLNAYSISGVFTSDSGTYNVRVSNGAGSATSSNAVLTIGNPPVLTLQPTSLIVTQGQTASFSASASGDQQMYYFWRKNGIIISGATNTSFAIASVLPSDAATYTFVASNFVGTAVSTGAVLTVYYSPTISTQPVGGTFGVNSNFTVNVMATGNPISYQWRLNGTPIYGAINSNYSVVGAQTTDAGNYDVIVSNFLGSVTSSVAVVSIIYYPPVITAQPTGANLLGGVPYTFGVTATGSALAYQWLKDGNALPGANGNTLTLPDLCINDSGNYTVTITNPVGSVTSSVVNLSVYYIYNQPTGGNALAGSSFTFNVGAQGTALTYQWQENGFNISNATSANLTLTNVTLSDAGNYAVVVTNYYGSETSSVAALYVGYAPFITQQPTSTTNAFGGTAIFSCGATGPLPMNYQWLQNNTGLPGQTSATLTLTNLQLQTVGNYQVIVGNTFGSITSSVAILHISPGMVIQPTNQIVMPGSPAGFTFLACGEPPLTYQWQLNGTNLTDNSIYSGSTSNILNLVAALTNTVGNYTIAVSNSYGSITSAVATLSYGFQAVSTFNYTGIVQPYIVPEGVTQLWVSITGGNGAYAGSGWDNGYGGGAGGNATGIISVTPNSVLTLSVGSSAIQFNGGLSPLIGYGGGSSGGYFGGGGASSLVVMPDGGSIICGGGGGGGSGSADNYHPIGGSSIVISFTNIQTTGGSGSGGAGGGGAAAGSAGVSTFNGSAAGGAGFAAGPNGEYSGCGGAGGSFLPTNYLYSQYTWQFTNLPIAGQNGSITIVANPIPYISQQPASQFAIADSPAQFNIGVSSPVPFSYQWFWNGAAVPNGTNSSLPFSAVTPQNAGTYFVVITNVYASVTSSVVSLTVNIPAYITSQPQNQSVLQGGSANFGVVATGDPSLAYQWYQQLNISATAAPLYGQTNTTLNISGATINDAGYYFVIVTNNFGSVTSVLATLTVLDVPPTITSQPASQNVLVGNNASFVVSASGTPSLGYQWQKNGFNLSAATLSTYSIPSTSTNDTGLYLVIVTNDYGSATSSIASLVVGVLPQNFGITIANSKSVQVQLAGTPNFPYVLQSATNLNPPVAWQNIITNISDSAGNWTFVDTNAINYPARFYRLQLQ